MQAEDVHRRHGETSAVDETCDVSIELDEVETGFSGFDFVGVFL